MTDQEGREVIVKPKTSPTAGVHTLNWHVTAVDTHQTAGLYTFTVQP